MLWRGIVATLLLAGCDLEEAERMDISRAGCAAVEPAFGGILFDGSREIPLTRLVDAVRGQSMAKAWSVSWTDSGTVEIPDFGIRGAYQRTPLFECLWIGNPGLASCNTLLDGILDTLLRHGSEIRFTVLLSRNQEPFAEDGRELDLRIVDDRPLIEWDAAFDKVRDVRTGDTVELVFRNASGIDLDVFDEHEGLRALDDYLLTLAPGEIGHMRWIVTAAPGMPVSVLLHWGDWSSSHRFEYRNPSDE